jgi:PAS domain S-box-containing protein
MNARADTELVRRALADPERLAALKRTGLLDSPPEEPFDRLTRLGQQMLGLSIAQISIIDRDRQFFKSKLLRDGSPVTTRETALDRSFCQYSVAFDEPLIVPDAREHPLLHDNLAIEDGVIAYAGVPLHDDRGHALGVYCAIDDAPREWSEAEISLVRDLAATAQAEILLRIANADAESANRRLRALVDAAYEAFVGVSPECTIVEWNGSAERILGWTKEEVVGKEAGPTFLEPAELERFRRAHQAYLAGEHPPEFGSRTSTCALHKSGRRLSVEVTITPFERGADGYAVFLHDVTLQRENEERRERLLAQERETVVKLQALDQLKDNVISHVSHELRSPLTSILGYTQLLLDEELDEALQTPIRTIARNADRLQRVIDDLLFLSRADARKADVALEPVDLPALMHDALDAVRPFADTSGLTIESAIQPGIVVAGDAGRLGQVLDNLLSNAVKYTPSGGFVRVRLAAHGTRALIDVEDTGIGVPTSERGRLFERFFRASTATERAIAGTGLGLAISKTIVEAHGGEIAVDKGSNGRGTRFTVTLPLPARTA